MKNYCLTLLLLISTCISLMAQPDFLSDHLADYKIQYSFKNPKWKNDSVVRYFDTAWASTRKDKAAYLFLGYEKNGVVTSMEYDVAYQQPYRQLFYTDKNFTQISGTATIFHNKDVVKSKVNYRNGLKHGNYRAYNIHGDIVDSLIFENGIIIDKGYLSYSSGKQKLKLDFNKQGAGTVTAYHPNGAVYYTGTYAAHNFKTGQWKYFDETGVAMMDISYDQSVATESSCYDHLGRPMKKCIDFQLPEFPGGRGGLSKFISENFQNHNRRKRGKIVIKFLIDKEGVADYENIQYLETIGEEYHDAVKFMVSQMPKWQPAISNNRPVDCYYTLPFTIKDDARFYHMED